MTFLYVLPPRGEVRSLDAPSTVANHVVEDSK